MFGPSGPSDGGVGSPTAAAGAPADRLTAASPPSDTIGITPTTLSPGTAAARMTFLAGDTATGAGAATPTIGETFATAPSALASVIAGVEPALVNEFAGAGASVTPQQPGAGFALRPDSTLAGSPTPTLDSGQTVEGVFRPNG